MRYLFAVIAVLLHSIATSHAQTSTPYAGFQVRAIKALPQDQQADLKAGRGMGLALAAELNGYPGPLHVIELADQLALSELQRAEFRRLYDDMKAEAILLGEKLLALEADLDRLFASRSITPESLAAVTTAIGATRGALRNTHLKYHLSAAAILSASQISRYAELRGYANERPAHNRPHH